MASSRSSGVMAKRETLHHFTHSHCLLSDMTRGARSKHPGEDQARTPSPGTPSHVSRVFPVPRREVSTFPGELTQQLPTSSQENSRRVVLIYSKLHSSRHKAVTVPAAQRRRSQSVPQRPALPLQGSRRVWPTGNPTVQQLLQPLQELDLLCGACCGDSVRRVEGEVNFHVVFRQRILFGTHPFPTLTLEALCSQQ